VEEVAREWKEAAETESGGHPLVRRTCAEHFLAERTPRCETLVRVRDLTKGLRTDGIRVVALRILARPETCAGDGEKSGALLGDDRQPASVVI
jgi:hypothetical protein